VGVKLELTISMYSVERNGMLREDSVSGDVPELGNN
jgi:hypothetical protein